MSAGAGAVENDLGCCPEPYGVALGVRRGTRLPRGPDPRWRRRSWRAPRGALPGACAGSVLGAQGGPRPLRLWCAAVERELSGGVPCIDNYGHGRSGLTVGVGLCGRGAGWKADAPGGRRTVRWMTVVEPVRGGRQARA